MRMTAPLLRLVAFSACRLGALAVVMALIAGIMGMHTMTAGHSGHTTAATADVSDHCASATCSGDCAEMPGMGASCTPLAKTTSLVVAAPRTSPFGVERGRNEVLASPLPLIYVPDGPSPGEMSISRT
ncbi:hypothetical protein ACIQC5_14505 [Paenarthrobacter sp. NPDC092416]|uniref:hypothetical protein n=1 Tax=Paenarthrobacter sp. NPDC092416 TaxID=3364386 RepID=UPI003828F922